MRYITVVTRGKVYDLNITRDKNWYPIVNCTFEEEYRDFYETYSPLCFDDSKEFLLYGQLGNSEPRSLQ